ncbi:MAG TPA: hypothetical protein VH593_23540 [Ktedonobacteraceae bacterium]|jgi:hypothetical protein
MNESPQERQGNSEELRVFAPCVAMEEAGSCILGERYLLSMPLGLRPDSYDVARRFLVDLVSHCVAYKGYTHESYIALHQTRTRETIELFADHARDWLPETILGVWTHLSAPHLMTSEAMMEMVDQSQAALRVPTLFRVTTGIQGCLDAMSTMAGTGTGIQIVSRIEATKLLCNLKDLFLDFIKERLFRIFPWYVPLLTMKSLEDPIAPLTEQALTDISLYIRESLEDGGILILSCEPLEEVLLRIGCRPTELTQGMRQWRLPE